MERLRRLVAGYSLMTPERRRSISHGGNHHGDTEKKKKKKKKKRNDQWSIVNCHMSCKENHPGASRHPCYVGAGQGQSPCVSKKHRSKQEEDTNVLSVARLLPRRSPNCF